MKLVPCGKQTLKDRLAGRHKPIDEVTTPCFVKARAAEIRAGEYFEALGYDVEIGCGARGADLKITKNGAQKAVEVKSCIKYSVGNSWYVHRVTPLRRNDDIVAIVLPCGSVYVEAMSSHLSKCTRDGRRTVTTIVMRRSA